MPHSEEDGNKLSTMMMVMTPPCVVEDGLLTMAAVRLPYHAPMELKLVAAHSWRIARLNRLEQKIRRPANLFKSSVSGFR